MIKKGKYKHFKGNYYEVLGVGTHTETQQELVSYKALYGDYSLHFRPLSMFLEMVEHDGALVSRFEFVGEIPTDSDLLLPIK